MKKNTPALFDALYQATFELFCPKTFDEAVTPNWGAGFIYTED